MTNFKFVISEPDTKKSYQSEVDQSKAAGVIGKKIGDEINGDFLGLSGYTFKITGGTDKNGFMMHPSVQGIMMKRLLLTGPPGFHPKIKGERRRKTVRGNTVSEDIVQINVKVLKKGEKPLAEIFGKVEQAKPKEEKKTEEKKVEVKKEETKQEGEGSTTAKIEGTQS